jgi:hypothetical protein
MCGKDRREKVAVKQMEWGLTGGRGYVADRDRLGTGLDDRTGGNETKIASTRNGIEACNRRVDIGALR